MTTQTATLTDFLLARIAEDEATVPDWHRAECARAARPTAVCDCGAAHQSPTWTRALAECEAKRRIVTLHSERGGHCAVCIENPLSQWREHEDYPCPTLLALALPYAHHPDYQEAWRV